jgi:hypothetical protein
MKVLAALLLCFGVSSAAAQGRGRAKPADGDAQVSNAKVKGPGTEVEIRIIRDFYSVQSRKPKSLPPGIAKNLGRGKPLPPGIAKTRVPDDLIVLLPARSGTRWIIAGDVVLLVDAGDLIVDLVRLIF